MKQFTKYLKKIQSAVLATSLVCSVAISAVPMAASAAPAVSAPFTSGAKVSFTFDDSLQSAVTQAAPVLAKYNYPGVDYVISGCVGMVTVPNTCAANQNLPYMTWAQVAALKNTYGWEVASHTVSHPQLSTDRISGIITAQQMVDEINNSKTAIAAGSGVDPVNFADPYGDYDNISIAAIAKTYESHRGFADIGTNAFPYNDYLLNVQQIQGNVTVAAAKTLIDQAKASGQWLVLVFHEIKASGASTALDAYEYNAGDLDQIAAYVQSQNIPVTDIAHGLANSGTNLFANGTFDTAPAAADDAAHSTWWTDDAANIKQDQANNGSYPSAVNSIAMTGNAAFTGGRELISPTVAVDPLQTYIVKSYVNVTSTSGEVDFLVDEYDAAGTWLSGKYVAGVAGATVATTIAVKNVNFTYVPTTATVAKARVQVIVKGTGAKAYVDNIQMFPVSAIGSATTTPPTTLAGDLNNDGKVNLNDLSILSNNWNSVTATAAQGDLNGDGKVNLNDLSILSNNWSK
ncbi:MAG TPA: polysaccharide deacetylase family protein [Candidatus Saccharimonadales bacterium]|jgi:peptidoglycan/xylan/chitin deacetylase (PgdA/CDA1 family)|nr:polysaccharide deacetylase family protein [Candidatus Saccharimonadales bacterium]